MLALIIVGAVAFYAGMQYQKSQARTGFAQFAQNGQGGNRQFRFGRGAGGANGGAVLGRVVSVDADSLTVKLPDGSSKIVNLSSSTTYNKSATGAKSDITTGINIAAFGTPNSDGSVTAQSVSINPMMRFGRTEVSPSPKQ